MLWATGSEPERPMRQSQRQRDVAAKFPSSPTEREREREIKGWAEELRFRMDVQCVYACVCVCVGTCECVSDSMVHL